MPTASTELKGSDLRWKRIYVPGSRKVIHQDLNVDRGTYRLREVRKAIYKVSWIEGDDMREEVDLGQYRYRRECDERVLDHIATGH